jgi:hypothetical protein
MTYFAAALAANFFQISFNIESKFTAKLGGCCQKIDWYLSGTRGHGAAAVMYPIVGSWWFPSTAPISIPTMVCDLAREIPRFEISTV